MSLSLPISEREITIRIPLHKLKLRMRKGAAGAAIEPLNVLLGPTRTQAIAIAEKIAKVGQTGKLRRYLQETWKKSKPIRKGSPTRNVMISPAAWQWIDVDRFRLMYSKDHRQLVVDGEVLRRDRVLRNTLMMQTHRFLTDEQKKTVAQKIRTGQKIRVDSELLPPFAKRMAAKYIIYRGPNCFHAALAFHSPRMTSSSLINVKKEKGYHRAMINYDELWRVLNRNFYEVNPRLSSLKYGDMLVFFDIPRGGKRSVDFKTIRHTATYLFGGYTFSKGSKSPNTPYTVRTLADEWQTWKRYTKNMGVKVFRRSKNHVTTRPPKDLSDWMY